MKAGNNPKNMPEPEINIHELKKMLKRIVWDYNISEDDLLKIFLHNEKEHSMNKPDIESRLLGYYNWHRLIRVLGYQGSVKIIKR